MGFIGISNHDLDMSKMSRFLILRRSDLDMEDLKNTSKDIFKGILGSKNINFPIIEPILNFMAETYN